MINDDPPPGRPGRIRLRQAMSTAVVSVLLGASIPMARKLILGSPDPFQAGWPLFLHAAAAGAALVVTWRWKHGVMSAVGVYAGLVAYLLACETPEYPGASLVALALHGLIPALAGSLVGILMSRRFVRCSRTSAKV